jgi:hypothetical protein
MKQNGFVSTVYFFYLFAFTVNQNSKLFYFRITYFYFSKFKIDEITNDKSISTIQGNEADYIEDVSI